MPIGLFVTKRCLHSPLLLHFFGSFPCLCPPPSVWCLAFMVGPTLENVCKLTLDSRGPHQLSSRQISLYPKIGVGVYQPTTWRLFLGRPRRGKGRLGRERGQVEMRVRVILPYKDVCTYMRWRCRRDVQEKCSELPGKEEWSKSETTPSAQLVFAVGNVPVSSRWKQPEWSFGSQVWKRFESSFGSDTGLVPEQTFRSRMKS